MDVVHTVYSLVCVLLKVRESESSSLIKIFPKTDSLKLSTNGKKASPPTQHKMAINFSECVNVEIFFVWYPISLYSISFPNICFATKMVCQLVVPKEEPKHLEKLEKLLLTYANCSLKEVVRFQQFVDIFFWNKLKELN